MPSFYGFTLFYTTFCSRSVGLFVELFGLGICIAFPDFGVFFQNLSKLLAHVISFVTSSASNKAGAKIPPSKLKGKEFPKVLRTSPNRNSFALQLHSLQSLQSPTHTHTLFSSFFSHLEPHTGSVPFEVQVKKLQKFSVPAVPLPPPGLLSVSTKQVLLFLHHMETISSVVWS